MINQNDRPIIGVLAQESICLKKDVPDWCKSHIAASYVKFIECAGARVLPIFIGKDEEYYEKTISNINGVLLPGGATFFDEKDGYADAGEYIFNIAKRLNENGIYFPLFGICLGFELLICVSANVRECRHKCSNLGNSLSLTFTEDFRDSKMFKIVPEEIVDTFSHKNVATFFHQYCITKELLQELGAENDWHILSYNTDINGKEVISSIESKKYPFYGVQFHPEKNLFEWNEQYKICHSPEAIKANRFFADFLIGEARKNNQKFQNIEEERESLIYNYNATHTGKHIKFEQCYLLK